MSPDAAARRKCPRCSFSCDPGDTACSRCGQELDGEFSALAARGGKPAPPRVELTREERDAVVAQRRKRIFWGDVVLGAVLGLGGAIVGSNAGPLSWIAGLSIGIAGGVGLNRTGGPIHCAAYFGGGACVAIGIELAITGGMASGAWAAVNSVRILLLTCIGLLVGRERDAAYFDGLA